MPELLKVYAVEGRLCPIVAPDGATLMGRYVARDAKGEPMPEGELVADTSYYRRRLAHGDLASAPHATGRVEVHTTAGLAGHVSPVDVKPDGSVEVHAPDGATLTVTNTATPDTQETV